MFKYIDMQYISLTPDKILISLVYRILFYVNIYGSYKLPKTVRFFGPPCINIVKHMDFCRAFLRVELSLHYGFNYRNVRIIGQHY